MKKHRMTPVKLVYSYSHKDDRHREAMKRALSTLRMEGLMREWSDVRILPGESISSEIRENLNEADVVVFLLSNHFLDSTECLKEWRSASDDPMTVCVPIILEPCPWKDLPGLADIKALPTDAKPVTKFRPQAQAWKTVHEGIRDVIQRVRSTFTLRDAFREKMEKTVFLSQAHVSLREVFVFPVLSAYASRSGPDGIEEIIQDPSDLLKRGHLLIHGEHLSGKTALCRALFLGLVDDDALPALYVDLADAPGPPTEGTLRRAYEEAFTGAYSFWVKEPKKILLLDNFSRHRVSVEFAALARKFFSTVIITLATDTFYSYYRDDESLSDFGEIRIQPFSHRKQELLIRKRLAVSAPDDPVSDGHVDELEKHVNAAVLADKLLPRYPFYVLSVLQIYEGFMPRDLTISSYGYCYYVVILAHLMKSGIPNSDADIAPCLNFSEHLAFEICRSGAANKKLGRERLASFEEEYQERFIISRATLRRLSDGEYGIVSDEGAFRDTYMYYYFLGRYLANHQNEEEDLIQRMLDESYRTDNALTLIFTIHHSSGDRLIDMIRERTLKVFSDVSPARLDKTEAGLFEETVSSLPRNFLTTNAVEAERAREREDRDKVANKPGAEPLLDEPAEQAAEEINDLYRIFKNNEILGHILRNNYGSLERPKVEQLVEAVADGGLKLVRLLLLEKSEINALAVHLKRRNPSHDLDKIKEMIRFMSFMWAVHNIERVVAALGRRELRSTVDNVVARRNSPAYDLIGYFLRLDTIRSLGGEEVKHVKSLLKKHRYSFFRWLVSARTQFYMNRHKIEERKEQSMCSALGIRYRQRFKRLA